MRKFVKILSYVMLFIFIFSSAITIEKIYTTWKTTNTNNQLQDLKIDTHNKWREEFLSINEDFVGWLTVPGTSVDGPVVKGKDNNEYLRKNFYKEKSISGTFFVDEMVNLDEKDGNIIIYGHMMKDDTMFGSLKKYKDIDFFKENNIVCWEDKNGEHYYKLFAAALVSGSKTNTNYMNIQQWTKQLNEKETKEMLETLKDKSYLYQDDQFRGEGQYIFLVTCDYSQYAGKLVLVGKKLE